ncbi:MAG: MFS transporter [Burkholderiales bacterium]|nr:MFS transporter [Burkholderiales bacterium]
MGLMRSVRPVLPILIGAALTLSLALGMRQTLGIFMPPLTRDIGIRVSDFTIAISAQNLVWGVLQPFSGALVVRWGFRPVMLAGAVLYVAGLTTLALAQGLWQVIIGAGVLTGMSMACIGSSVTMAVTARAVPVAIRSTMLGIVAAAGSIGAMLAAPVGQWLSVHYGWRVGVLGFVVFAIAILPAAWYAGRVDKLPLPPPVRDDTVRNTFGSAALMALRNPGFMVMALAYFVCGMQLVFLTTHLPSYLEICGMDPMLSAQALGVIGGANVLGSLFFGWAGNRWNKQALLGGIYILRSITLVWYFMGAPTPAGTLLFAGIMGFLWLGVSPLVAGSVTEMFGLRWQAMITGLAFFSHQLGSFAGAFGGGVLYDLLGSYTLAWQLGVALGLAAGIGQLAFALARPMPPPPRSAAPA